MANGVAVPEMLAAARHAGRRRPLVVLGAGALILSAVALGLGMAQGVPWLQGGQTVEVALVARNMKFNETNPRIAVRLGDTLRLAVQNDEPAGIAHDLIIAGPGGLTSRHIRPGESQVLTFRPSTPGVYHYSCSLHPRLMDGEIVVRP